ncbi:MAG: DegQ family serine endoprotease [Pseudomonadota bacterium]
MPTDVFTSRKKSIIALATAALVGAAGAGAITSHALLQDRAQTVANASATGPNGTAAPLNTAPASGSATTPATVTLPDFSRITEQRGPGVVNISVTGTVKTSGNGSPFPGMDPDDPVFQFFKRFGGIPQQQGPREQTVRGQGSGFIVSSDGVILTNAHVVQDAKDVTVKLPDRREYKAKVVGTDPKTDVAVIKIDAKDLPYLPLGNTRDLKVGEWVLAIGAPFGFENTVTAGVVSAKGRSLPDDSFVPFIQTDVAVNPGNSGGPLFNARGEVVGINSQIYSRTGGYQGVSFAIPIEVATKVRDQILKSGKASHARLGVVIQEVNQAFADSFKLDKPEGALVSSIEKGGPADQAGLKVGDVIRKVNGQAIVASGDLPALVGQATPGDKITLEVWRDGKQQELSARLGDANEKAARLASADTNAEQGRLGLALRPLQPQERRDAGVDAGLMIEDTEGPAELAGLHPGDVLVAVNGTPVKSVDQVRGLIDKSSKSVALLIQRDGQKIFVPVRLG